MNETDLKKQIRDLLTVKQIFHYNAWQGPLSVPGISDLIGCQVTDDLRRAFVAGAKWWEWKSTDFTMWDSDQILAVEEAERRYTSKFGRFFAIEVKGPRAKTSGKTYENQVGFIENVVKAGGIAFMARSIEDVIEGLKIKGVK